MDKDEAIKTLEENSKEWLAAILKNEGNGFGEEIVDFNPEPSEDNNWLWDEEEEKFEGQIMTDTGSVFEFTISKNGEDWSSSTKMITDEEGNEIEAEDVVMTETEEVVEEDSESEEEMSEVERMRQEIALLREQLPKEEVVKEEDSESEILKRELMELRKEVSQYKESVKKDKQKDIRTFCECLYEDGKMTEGYFPKEGLEGILIALLGLDMEAPLTYSEGNDQVSVLDGVKKLLSNLPKTVEFSESTTRQIEEPLLKEEIPTAYGEVDPESKKEYMKIRKYMKDNGIKNFLEAKRKMASDY